MLQRYNLYSKKLCVKVCHHLVMTDYIQDDLHYDDDTIARMLAVKPASLRTARSRIKGR